MDAGTSGADGGGSSGDESQEIRRRGGMSRWLHGAVARGDARAERLVEELEAEVALLREENARLRTRSERRGGRPWGVQMGDLVPGRASQDGRADDASELLTECRILRTELLDACRDVEHAVREIRGRLEQLQPPETASPRVQGPRASAER